MKTILQKTFIMFLAAVALASCSKNDEPCDPNDEESSCYAGPSGISEGNKLLLIEQKINGKTIGKFEYDAQNRMIRNYPYGADGLNKTIISYTYNANGLLSVTNHTNQDGEIITREEYTYNSGNKPVSMIQTTPNRTDTPPIDWQFTYSNNLLTSESAIPREKDALIITMLYTYDSEGNLLSWEQRADEEWLTTIEYGDYDDKIFIGKYGNPYFWKAANSNSSNPQTEKITSQNTNANKDLIIKYSYNDSGYPVKAEVYNRAVDNVVETREYLYKKAN